MHQESRQLLGGIGIERAEQGATFFDPGEPLSQDLDVEPLSPEAANHAGDLPRAGRVGAQKYPRKINPAGSPQWEVGQLRRQVDDHRGTAGL